MCTVKLFNFFEPQFPHGYHNSHGEEKKKPIHEALVL